MRRYSTLIKKLVFSFSVIILIIIVTFIVSNAGRHNDSSQKILNVLNWTSYIPDEVIEDFENEYNIKVNYGTYSSNEELLAKLTSSKEGTYDLVFPSDYMVNLMISRGLLESIDHEKFSNIDNINPLFLNQAYDPKNNYSLPFLLATTVFLYDSTVVDHLTSYKDLQNPVLYNNLVMLDDQRIVIGAMLNACGYNTKNISKKA